MSWGTNFRMVEFINRMHFDNEQQVKDKLKEIKEDTTDIEQKLLQYAVSTPKDICLRPEEFDTAIDCINVSMGNILDMYKENIILEYQLKNLLENWSTKENY